MISRYNCKISLTAFITVILTMTLPAANILGLFQQEQVLAQTTADRKAEADRLLQQGIKQTQTRELKAALQSFQQALIIYRQIKDRKREAASLIYQGLIYLDLADSVSAIAPLKKALAIAKEINNQELEKFAQESILLAENQSAPRKAEADRLLQQGNKQAQTSQFEAALQSWQKALIIYRQIKDRKGEGQSSLGIGIAYDSLGDYAKAIDYYQKSLAIAREIKDRKAEVKALDNLGISYFSLGDYAKAIDYHQQSLAIAREIKYRQGEEQSLGNLGNAYYSLGDYAKTIEYEQQSLAIAREIKYRQGEEQSLGNLGAAYEVLGDYVKAIEYQQQRLAIAREIKNRLGEGQSLGNLGNVYDSLGDYAKAIDYHQQSLAISRQVKDPLGEEIALGNLGRAYDSLGDYAKAIDYYQKSLAIAREIKDRLGEGLALNNLGAAYQKSGNLKAAETTLRTGIEVWESLRERLGKNDSYKISIFEAQAVTYRTLQQVLIAQNKTNDALEISERGRSRAFVELLTSRLSHNSASQPPEKPTIPLLQQIAKQQNATLVEYSVIYNNVKIQGKEETKESELYIWVIKPTGEVTFRKVDLKSLEEKDNTTLDKLVTISRESIGARGRGGGILVGQNPDAPKAKQRFQQLHQLLIEPIADLLPKQETEKIIFIPQKSLFLVPFPALQDKQGKYLIEKHTILTAPSIQVLDLTHKQRHGNIASSLQNSLIVGNPTMPKVILEPGQPAQQLKSLLGAEKEAKDIASLLKTQAITGNQATKAAIVTKMSQAGIVHLATHGILDDNRGIGSAVALAPSGKDNGLLTADEILNLKLKADLIVLSACDTGRGRITGDGVIGLSRALISAGVSSVIVSIWAVDDNSTSFLMTEFYKNLQQKLDKATALRKAMLTTMQQKDYVNPLQWAAFTLIGETE